MKRKTIKASITVECSLALPIFICCVLGLYSLMLVLNTYAKVNVSLHEAGKELAYCAYPLEQIDDDKEQSNIYTDISQMILPETYVQTRMVSLMGFEETANSSIKGKILGFNLLRSSVEEENDINDFIVTYTITPWFMSDGGIKLENRCRMKKWTGYERAQGTGSTEYVYVTPNGKAYHTNYDCAYLHPSIHSCPVENIADARNKSGSKYTECSKCRKLQQGDEVYITDWGERYHNSITCAELERTIKKISISDVGDRSLCEKCAWYIKGDVSNDD